MNSIKKYLTCVPVLCLALLVSPVAFAEGSGNTSPPPPAPGTLVSDGEYHSGPGGGFTFPGDCEVTAIDNCTVKEVTDKDGKKTKKVSPNDPKEPWKFKFKGFKAKLTSPDELKGKPRAPQKKEDKKQEGKGGKKNKKT